MDREPTRERHDAMTQAIGWFSVALGAAELIAPSRVSRLIGVPPDAKTVSLVRAMGAREIGNGIAILSKPGTAAPLWSRLAGDVADLGFLAAAYETRDDGNRQRLMATIAAVAGISALDVICARRLTPRTGSKNGESENGAYAPARVVTAITVNRPIEQVYAFWRDLANLPRFMRYIDSVEPLADGTSRWRASGPGGIHVEWIAEIVNERENELIAWRSIPHARVQSTGIVRFKPAPGARGTEVHVDMDFRPPAGTVGKAVAWLTSRHPSSQMHQDLQRFKQLLETGEIALSEGAGLRNPGRPTGKADRVRTLAGVTR